MTAKSVKCSKCGREIADKGTICPECGETIWDNIPSLSWASSFAEMREMLSDSEKKPGEGLDHNFAQDQVRRWAIGLR